ncbi:hypothetical protein WDL1P1_00390 (plasmid) [Variovorax sp. WDL1]|nr:hypothetical protein CHC06_05963 [Variovorax sp. B2]PNG51213.1 hypothetical protein CHC07_05869 [Variovorax sp. B4]VTV17438.1 hypothetical protein WDL1P1_00390 [Variovorax sp. WDL1]
MKRVCAYSKRELALRNGQPALSPAIRGLT